ncbi:PhoX family protein [Campylobacter hyointestinalis]|uniref:PhoX family protein n=1 Tax=Campylobacter hyointestinalis TaxID=198 RepID=UPI000DCE2A72|nr:PhoX family phosphatase [Campylobacter hyointestinalis]RAZ56508.1 PhoX family phosphatase [Campylobacter hyointestinalis subsp. lawsonii]RAZ64613.1 PhoX family phosphatase [Campylobacter hyointestinalis subsp. lawsonii]
MQRRSVLKLGSLGLMSGFFTNSLIGANTKNLIGFEQIAISTDDDFKVAKGYSAKVLVKWSDPIFSHAKEFDESKNIDDDYVKNANFVFGDDADGQKYFAINGSKEGLLVTNNEYVNPELMFNHNGKNMSANDIKYQQNSLGVTILNIKRDGSNFYKYKIDSKYNRRINANTPILITGEAKGDDALKTATDPKGELVFGTLNNCGCGKTPWGTYLTCEENFDDFFGSKDSKFMPSKSFERYGIKAKGSVYAWHLFDDRFDIKATPNEANRFGWVVEIDPFDPKSMPKKRTSLGRFKHENCEVVVDKFDNVVAYSGDDENNEFVYKFVAKNKFDRTNLKANLDILEFGTLYVAKFEGEFGEFKGRLKWIELTFGKNGLTKENGFISQADILIRAREAASFVGATPMDRCEWISKDPNSEFLYATFTNNKVRQEVDAANPRAKNKYGQILKWAPKNGDHANGDFSWEIFILAGNPKIKDGLYKGSNNINLNNMFNSPDGLAFDKDGRLWIATDGSYSNTGDYEDMGNNQLLCADPYSGEVKRFATGPRACELTGIAFSDDYKTMFISVQHPGEELKGSHWPEGGSHTPKSAVVMITKDDGGIIGA